MSVLHETSKDKENERRIIELVSKKWKVDVRYTPVAYHMDGVLLNGNKVRAFAEARIRNNPRNQYSTYILSLQKYKYIVEIFNITGLATFLLVEWTDGIHYLKLTNEVFPLGWVNRKKSTLRDERDNEPCIEIPVERFSLV